MLDFSKVPFPDSPVGATVVGSIVELNRNPIPQPPPKEIEDYDPGAIVDLNLDGAKRALALFNDQIAHWEAEAAALIVNSPESAANCTEMVGQVKRLLSTIEARRKEIIAEPDKFVRLTNGFVKPMVDKLKALENIILKRKLGDYALQVELQRREIERKQREARDALQKQIDADAKAKGVESVQVAPVAIPTRKEPTRSDTAIASTVMAWKHEVTDPAAVPREYLMVNDAAVKAAVRAGIREIPGVRIFEEAEMRIRRVG